MYYPETVYARSKDGNVAYQVVGDGPQDLVFIPSWLSNIDAMWEEPSLAHFLRRLATFGRLLCFDKRGAGASDTVSLAELPTLEQWSDDVPNRNGGRGLKAGGTARSRRGRSDGHAVRCDLPGANLGVDPCQ